MALFAQARQQCRSSRVCASSRYWKVLLIRIFIVRFNLFFHVLLMKLVNRSDNCSRFRVRT